MNCFRGEFRVHSLIYSPQFQEVIELSLKEQDLDNGLRIFEQKLQSKFPKVQAPVEKSEDDKEKKEIVEDKAAEEQKLEVKHILEHTLRLFAENLVVCISRVDQT